MDLFFFFVFFRMAFTLSRGAPHAYIINIFLFLFFFSFSFFLFFKEIVPKSHKSLSQSEVKSIESSYQKNNYKSQKAPSNL
jgi:dolichol kinase